MRLGLWGMLAVFSCQSPSTSQRDAAPAAAVPAPGPSPAPASALSKHQLEFTEQLSDSQYRHYSPTWSPDGKSLVVANWTKCSAELVRVAKPMETVALPPVCTPSDDQPGNVLFAGSRLIVWRYREDGVVVIDLEGGAKSASHPWPEKVDRILAVSPDGTLFLGSRFPVRSLLVLVSLVDGTRSTSGPTERMGGWWRFDPTGKKLLSHGSKKVALYSLPSLDDPSLVPGDWDGAGFELDGTAWLVKKEKKQTRFVTLDLETGKPGREVVATAPDVELTGTGEVWYRTPKKKVMALPLAVDAVPRELDYNPWESRDGKLYFESMKDGWVLRLGKGGEIVGRAAPPGGRQAIFKWKSLGGVYRASEKSSGAQGNACEGLVVRLTVTEGGIDGRAKFQVSTSAEGSQDRSLTWAAAQIEKVNEHSGQLAGTLGAAPFSASFEFTTGTVERLIAKFDGAPGPCARHTFMLTRTQTQSEL